VGLLGGSWRCDGFPASESILSPINSDTIGLILYAPLFTMKFRLCLGRAAFRIYDMKSPTILVQLIHIHGPGKGEIQEFFDGIISIGRHPSCNLLFPAELTSISRRHAEIRREGNQFKLVDSSSNGTFVNGKKVTECFLREGDVLEFADGGPKVSFLTKIVDGSSVPGKPVSSPPASPSPGEAPAPVGKGVPEQPWMSSPEPPVPEPPVAEPARPSRPVVEPPPDAAVQKASVPLVIQYGPTIRSFRELPVVIGRNPGCDFVLDQPEILDRHAQIFHSQNRYWIKDLTGRKMIRLNAAPLELQAALSPNDRFSLGPRGPVFSFLGEGRIMEVLDSVNEASPDAGVGSGEENGRMEQKGEKKSGGFWSRMTKK
jgi:pSer/pThr/pTyr-binding forkhead associated (FHA) protein